MFYIIFLIIIIYLCFINYKLLNNKTNNNLEINQYNNDFEIKKYNNDFEIKKYNNDFEINQYNNDFEIKKYNNNPILNEYKHIYNINRKVLYDDFEPPERRYFNRLINIPSRGYPDDYQLFGILIRDNTETAYNLFGRQKYPGSSQYEYYIEGKSNNNTKIKIPLNITGDKELEDNTFINIPGADETKGKFQIKLYKFSDLKYIPY